MWIQLRCSSKPKIHRFLEKWKYDFRTTSLYLVILFHHKRGLVSFNCSFVEECRKVYGSEEESSTKASSQFMSTYILLPAAFVHSVWWRVIAHIVMYATHARPNAYPYDCSFAIVLFVRSSARDTMDSSNLPTKEKNAFSASCSHSKWNSWTHFFSSLRMSYNFNFIMFEMFNAVTQVLHRE